MTTKIYPPNRIQYYREKRELSRRELAEQINCSVGQITKLERRERELTQGWMERLSGVLDVAPAKLMIPATQSRHPDVASEIVLGNARGIEFNSVTYMAIGVWDIRAAAGAGAVNDESEPASFNLYRAEWLHRITTAAPEHLAVIRVAGDSMWETLHDGDHVLVDRSQRGIGRDGIYIIDLGNELQVKRVSRHPGNKLLTIKSDNPAYPTYSDIRPEDIDVKGRVIWLGRNVGG